MKRTNVVTWKHQVISDIVMNDDINWLFDIDQEEKEERVKGNYMVLIARWVLAIVKKMGSSTICSTSSEN